MQADDDFTGLLDGLNEPNSPSMDGEKPPAILDGGEDVGKSDANESQLTLLAQRMRRVQQRMATGDTRSGTRHLQRQLTQDLTDLLEQIRKSQSNEEATSNPSGNSPTEQAPTLEDPGNQPEEGNPDNTPEMRAKDSADFEQIITHLPDRLRQQMRNASEERFLPKYEKLIEAYFRRLAEDEKDRS